MLFCNDAMVAIATTQVVLDLNRTFKAKLVDNGFMIFSAKNYLQPSCFGKVMPKNRRGPVFWDIVYNRFELIIQNSSFDFWIWLIALTLEGIQPVQSFSCRLCSVANILIEINSDSGH